ncbi:hypothetical protein RhiirA4_424095 [Rhizophagus irregularis]|uniref:Uncharacterized protein n=1 Tax=Rhizophagus irregularis TaxID=588596 RepID=A0A2I1GW68_9GLOM|nr:hypothetical protein RhiirA4_424095 [Rhizophagus irregularis]
MEKAIAAPIASLHDLQFHEHDPSAKKADEQLHTLVVTDIPLFVTDAQLRDTFSRYVFDSAFSMEQFETTWAVLCTGHYLRVCPASHSPDQCAIRRAHVAFLAELPRGSVVANFAEIAKEISAKSVNIPSHIIHTIPSLMPMYISRLLIPKNLQWVLPMPSRVLDLPDMNLMKICSTPSLQHRVKWLEDQYSSRPRPMSSQPSPSCPSVTKPDDQGWDNADSSDSRRCHRHLPHIGRLNSFSVQYYALTFKL